MQERKTVATLAPATHSFQLGPRLTVECLQWYAFFVDMPEQCSWKVFTQRFAAWEHWPAGVRQLITTLGLANHDAPAWKVFCVNMQPVRGLVLYPTHTTRRAHVSVTQDGGNGSGGVWMHEIAARFPADLVGLQLVGALKRYFAIPGYALPAADAPQPAAQLQRLLRDLDRCRRESNALEVRATARGCLLLGVVCTPIRNVVPELCHTSMMLKATCTQRIHGDGVDVSFQVFNKYLFRARTCCGQSTSACGTPRALWAPVWRRRCPRAC